MHLVIILTIFSLAWYLRNNGLVPVGNWSERWQQTLFLFLFPPLLLLMTALAILLMGMEGKMFGGMTGRISYGVSTFFLSGAAFLWFRLAYQGRKTLQKTRTYHQQNILGIPARLIETDALFIAQIGFWQPELVVSQPLLETFDQEHLEAALAHEQAHYYYRDTFWFFWLGWMRALTSWLPNTEILWQELLILRELRADRWATQKVDPLVLAESLLLVVSVLPAPSESFCAALSTTTSKSRLEERIDALLATPEKQPTTHWWDWSWLLLAFLPLITVFFHH
jgi:Zn-dependent protease with chaperone function